MRVLRLVAQNSDEIAELHPRRDLGFFELGFCYRPGLISMIRRFVGAFYGRLIPDSDGVERVALAVHELLECIAEFSTGGEFGLRVEVFEPGSQLFVSIRAKNRADASGSERLRGLFEELNRGADPSEAYQAAMRASLDRGDGSRMRLARVQAEAKMQLSVEEGADGELTVIASTKIPMASRP